MKTLLRFSWRELTRARLRFALITLILVIQATALGGGHVAQESLFATRDRWSRELHLADLEVQFTPASNVEMPSLDTLRSIPGVLDANRRFLARGQVELEGQKRLPALIQYLDARSHPSVNDVHVLSGRWLDHDRPDHVVVDRSFADAHGLKVGDSFVVDPGRGGPTLVVGGIGLSAEHLVPTANPELLVPQKGSLAVLYASRALLDKTFAEELYNDVVVTFAEGVRGEVTKAAVVSAMTRHDLALERVVPRDESFGHRFVDTMLAGTRDVSPTIALIVALMAALVTFVSVNRLITERRRDLGCLLSQGYSTRQLVTMFLGFGGLAGVIGGGFGVAGALVFGMRIATTAARLSGFPDPTLVAPPLWLGLAVLSSVVIGVLATVPPTVALLDIQPLGAMRGEGEVTFRGLPAALEWLVSGSVCMRYALRNVFRRAWLAGATALLVALAVGLPSGLITSVSSWETYADSEAARLAWDAVVAFRVPLRETEVSTMLSEKDNVGSWEGYVQGYASVAREDGVASEMRVRGIAANGTLTKLDLTAGTSFSSDDAAEVMWSTAFSGDHPAPRLGERVSLRKNGATYELTVVGHVATPTIATIVVPRGMATRIFGLEGKLTGVYLRYGEARGAATLPPAPSASVTGRPAEVIETIDIEPPASKPLPVASSSSSSSTRLADDERIASLELRTEFARATLEYLAGFNAIVIPFIGLGGALAFFFVLSVLGFLLVERETEYATLRSMGYAALQIAQMVLVEIGAVALVGLLLSLGTWVITTHLLREPMAATWFRIAPDFRPADFASCAMPIGALLVLAAMPGIRALVRADLGSVLRGRALG